MNKYPALQDLNAAALTAPPLSPYDRHCLRLLMQGKINGNGDAIRHLKRREFISNNLRELTDSGKLAVNSLSEAARQNPGGRKSNAIHTARAAALSRKSEGSESAS